MNESLQAALTAHMMDAAKRSPVVAARDAHVTAIASLDAQLAALDTEAQDYETTKASLEEARACRALGHGALDSLIADTQAAFDAQ